MFKNLIGFINSEILLIFKFQKSKFDLKYNFLNNYKNSNARRFINSYTLKWYEARRVKKSFIGSIFVQKFGPF